VNKLRQQEFHYLKQLANDRVKEKQDRLANLEMIYNFNCYDEFGYTKDEIEKQINDLKQYIHIATH